MEKVQIFLKKVLTREEKADILSKSLVEGKFPMGDEMKKLKKLKKST